MLCDKLDAGTLVQSLVKLADRHSAQVFQFVSDVLAAGGDGAKDIKEEFEFGRWRSKWG